MSLDVGGTRFVSARSTLEKSGHYFSSLLARWDENNAADEPLFIDADADAFQILLSYMRVGKLTLPKNDDGLCARVLLHADMLGMDNLLSEVKGTAYANMHPNHQDDARPPNVAFDEEVGSLSDAIDSGVLPARYFAPAPAPPEPPEPPPERVIKAIMPAAPGYRAMFTNGAFDYGDTREVDEDGDATEDRRQLDCRHRQLGSRRVS